MTQKRMTLNLWSRTWASEVGLLGGHIGAWIVSPVYGWVLTSIELALLVSLFVLVVSLPKDRSDRIFRLLRMLWGRPS
jgi:uncharacterized membrane protein